MHQEIYGEKWKLGATHIDVLVWLICCSCAPTVVGRHMFSRKRCHRSSAQYAEQTMLLMMRTHPLTAPLPYKACKTQSPWSRWHFCNHALPSPTKPPCGIYSCECMESWQCLGSLFTQGLTYWLDFDHTRCHRDRCVSKRQMIVCYFKLYQLINSTAPLYCCDAAITSWIINVSASLWLFY